MVGREALGLPLRDAVLGAAFLTLRIEVGHQLWHWICGPDSHRPTHPLCEVVSRSRGSEALRRSRELHYSLGIYLRCVLFFQDAAAALPHDREPVGIGEKGPQVCLNVTDLMPRTYKSHRVFRAVRIPAHPSDQSGQGMVPHLKLAQRGFAHGRIT